MGGLVSIHQGANVGQLKPMSWEYHPQRVITVEAWSIGPYFISNYGGKFILVKNYTLLATKDSLQEAIDVAEKDRRET